MIKQESAPLYEALTNYIKQANVSFHVPGHKHGRVLSGLMGDLPAAGVFSFDLTELPGLDDLHCSAGPIKKAQELAAELFHADESFLLVNGTTCGLQAAIMGLCGPEDRILVPRHAHRAVFGALVLSGAEPVYLRPEVDRDFGVPVGVVSADVTQAVREKQRIKAVLQINPTYHGFAANLAEVARSCHEHGIPVLVDEAHGAHFSFHQDLPAAAMDAGADISVQSTHKTLGALTQGSILHIRGDLINRHDVARNLRQLQTTSPSYLIMVSLDMVRRHMAGAGQAQLAEVLEMAYWIRARLAAIGGIKCAGMVTAAGWTLDGNTKLDPTKILINVTGLGLTGYEAAVVLQKENSIQVELADALNILLVLTIGTTWDDCRKLAAAMEKLALVYRPSNRSGRINPLALFYDIPIPSAALTPREAWFAPARPVLLEDARDCVAAETVAPYPPGIPVVCAGERITEDVVELLKYIRDNGIACQGLADYSKQTIMTVNL